jgi:hypothetical protein
MLQAGRSQVQDLMRWMIFINLPNPSSPTVALALTHILTEISIRKCFWGVKHSWRIRLIASPPSVSLLSRQCGILNFPQPYRPPPHVMGISLQRKGKKRSCSLRSRPDNKAIPFRTEYMVRNHNKRNICDLGSSCLLLQLSLSGWLQTWHFEKCWQENKSA